MKKRMEIHIKKGFSNLKLAGVIFDVIHSQKSVPTCNFTPICRQWLWVNVIKICLVSQWK